MSPVLKTMVKITLPMATKPGLRLEEPIFDVGKIGPTSNHILGFLVGGELWCKYDKVGTSFPGSLFWRFGALDFELNLILSSDIKGRHALNSG